MLQRSQRTVSQIIREISASEITSNDCLNSADRKEREEANTKLISTVNTLRKDNDKLKTDYSHLNEKLLTSEGEVSILRYEIKQLRQQHDQQRLDKIQEDNNQKKAFLDKIADLERNLKIQKTELELKKLEIGKFKSKNLNESQKITLGKENELLIECKRQLDLMKDKYFMELPLLYNQIISDKFVEIHPDIYVEAILEKRPNPKNIELSNNFKRLQNLLAQFQANQSTEYLNRNSNEILDIVLSSFSILLDLKNQLQFSNCRKKYLNPKFEYDFLSSQKPLIFSKGNVFQATEMFEGEKGIIGRRIIAGLAIFCGSSVEIIDLFFTRKVSVTDVGKQRMYTCFNMLYEILNALSFSSELQLYSGIVTASAHLLNNIGTLYRTKRFKLTNEVYEFLKINIFSSPSINGIVEISDFLANNYKKIISKLCVKYSNHKLLEASLKFSFYTPENCLLQIYGSIIEVTFPQNTLLSYPEVKSLLDVTRNTFKLIRYAVQESLDWTMNQSPECDCFNRLGVAAIVLFHLVVYHWIQDPKLVSRREVSTIVKSGIVVLSYIFKLNQRRTILQTGGYAISQRIQILYNWLTDYKSFFSLSKSQCKYCF